MTAQTLAFIEPCRAQGAAHPPAGEGWVHEIKFDGYRVQIHLQRPPAPRARLLTRTGLDWTGKFGRVVSELSQLAAQSAIIDAEAVVQDASGVSSFAALQRELKHGADARIVMMAFDLLHLNGSDLRHEPLLARKALLAELLGTRSPGTLLHYSQHIVGDGKDVLAGACGLGLEGIISKRTDSPYRSGRSATWIKAKCIMADPFVVIGYVTSKAASETVGSLLVAYYDAGRLIYAGRVGTGFTQNEARAIWEALQAIVVAPPALAKALPHEVRAVTVWVEPRLVVQIEYRAWSDEGILRHAAFKAFRHDKPAEQVERPSSLTQPEDK